MSELGLIQIYTGKGKGKSTAAFGLALRASGWGLHCAVIQFMKEGEWYGECRALADFPLIDIHSYGIGKFLKKGTPPDERSKELAAEAMAGARQLLADDKVDILILDELANAVYFDLVSEEDVLELMAAKRPDQELVITGRNATEAMIAKADLVSEIKEIKHPYNSGVQARKGIEY